jgi:proline racemase
MSRQPSPLDQPPRAKHDMSTHRIEVIDSHTGGEPTRVVVSGGPDLGTGPLALRRERFRH